MEIDTRKNFMLNRYRRNILFVFVLSFVLILNIEIMERYILSGRRVIARKQKYSWNKILFVT